MKQNDSLKQISICILLKHKLHPSLLVHYRYEFRKSKIENAKVKAKFTYNYLYNEVLILLFI